MTSNPPTLRKELTLISATALVVSNMIGTGIFTTTGFLAGDLGQVAHLDGRPDGAVAMVKRQ